MEVVEKVITLTVRVLTQTAEFLFLRLLEAEPNAREAASFGLGLPLPLVDSRLNECTTGTFTLNVYLKV